MVKNQNEEFEDLFESGDDELSAKLPLTAGASLSTIQMLRGFAALAVAVAHLHAVELKLGGPILFGNWALAGFGGVDLFFVISGFVMVWVTREHHGKLPRIGRFWFLRLLRIYPLWWLVLAAIFAVYLVRPEWVYQSHSSNPNLLNSFLLLPDKDLPLHAVGWTLIHELWFYFIFGIFLFFPSRFLPIMLGAWGAIILAFLGFGFTPIDPWLKLIRHPLTLEFILGAFIGLIAISYKYVSPKTIVIGAIIALFASLFRVTDSAQDFFGHEWQRVLWIGVPSAFLVLGCCGLEKRGYKAPKWSVALGDWSYALYLIHVPVFAAIGRLARPFANDGLIDNLIINSFALSAAIFAAFILHQFFEKPIMKAARRARN